MRRFDTLEKYIHNLFLLLFFPIFIFGVAVTNYYFLIFMCYFLFFYLKEIRNIIIENYKISFSFLIYYLFLLLSSFFSEHIFHSLETTLLYIFYLVYVSCLILILNLNPKNILYFLSFGLITFLVICLDASYELLNGSNIFGNASVDGRLAGLFGDRWVIGSYLIRFLPLLLGIYLLEIKSINSKFKVPIFLVFAYSLFIILFSGERAAFLLSFLYLFLIFIYFFRKIKIRYSLLIIFSISLFMSIPFLSIETSERLLDNVYLYSTNFDFNQNQYLAMYFSAIEMFKDNFILGIGPNNFRMVCDDEIYKLSIYSCSTHPHNIPLQVLSETGLFGFLFVYMVFFIFLSKSIKFIKEKSFNYRSLGLYSIQSSIIINLWPIITSGNFFLSWNGFIYFLPFAIYILYDKRLKIIP